MLARSYLIVQRMTNAVNRRSVTLGLSAVVFMAALAPFNNYVVANTDLIGSALPLGLVAFFVFFILGVNSFLWRWAPKRAFTAPELAVAIGMGMVGCAVPSVGLMRYLPGHLTVPFNMALANREYADMLREMHLPDWMFPTTSTLDPGLRGNDPVIRDFIRRAPIGEAGVIAHWRAVPWLAWMTPALTWGILLSGVWGAILCLSTIVRKQWVENERLAFPIATIYLSLIEEPSEGRRFNHLFSSRSFWIACLTVFILQGLDALHSYAPTGWPSISMGFKLTSMFLEDPWRFMELHFKQQRIYFTIIGIAFFLQSRIAFS